MSKARSPARSSRKHGVRIVGHANVPYDEVFELGEINRAFGQADVAFVIGANDVTNLAGKTNPASAIYGSPILDVERSRRCCSLSARWRPVMPASRTSCSSAPTP